MTTEIKVPVLPDSISDATVVAWHKKVGEPVRRDDNLVDLETDKVVLEVPAPADGVLTELKVQADDIVTADQVIALFEAGAIADETPNIASQQQENAAEETTTKAAVQQPTPTEPAIMLAAADNNLSPSQRRFAAEQGLSPGQLQQQNMVAAEAIPVRGEKRVPMSRLRQRIADRLLGVKQSTAMLTTFNEVDMSAIMDLRSRYKDQFEKIHGTRLGFMSFFTKAAVEALKRFPSINASIDGTDIVYHNYFDVGIAVSTERGLVVPVLRDVDQMSMANIEVKIRDFGKRGRDGKLGIEEITGGNFTITNGGVFGSMLSTPILNPPQSAILGMHNIVERPIAVKGEVVIRPIMYLALSYDHRIVDGKDSVQFLVTIKNLLEDPASLILGI